MRNFIYRIEKAAQKFKSLDFALFKLYICAVGVLLGAYFAPFFIDNILFVWIIAILCGGYICTRLIVNYLKK